MDDFSSRKDTPVPLGSIEERPEAPRPSDLEDSLKRKKFEDALGREDDVLSKEAESIVPDMSSSVAPQVDGTTSLRDVIDQVEKQLMSSLQDVDAAQNTRPEELDVLEIEAELGRPDPGVENIINSENKSRIPDEDEEITETSIAGISQNGGGPSGFGFDDYELEPASGDFSSLAPLAPEEFTDPLGEGWESAGSPGMHLDGYSDSTPNQPFTYEEGFGPLDTVRDSKTDATHESRQGVDSQDLDYENDFPTDPHLRAASGGEMTRVLDAPTPTVSPGAFPEGLRFVDGIRSRGNISEEPFWSLLIAARVDRYSGVLLIARKGVERRFYLDQGDVVIATSTAREDRLVELLYREGRLSDEEYSQAVLTIGTSGRRVGAVLAERGLISSRELFPLVRHHYESIVLDSFSWRDGTWELLDEKGYGGERILLEVSTATLIVEGIRSRAPWRDVEALVPLGSRPLEISSGICSIEEIGLVPEELAIYHACDGSSDITQIAERFELSIREIRGLFAGLVALGALHLEVFEPHYHQNGSDGAIEWNPEVSERAHTARGFHVERMRLADKMAQVKEGTYFQLLEVSPDASGYEIRKSYRSLKGQFAVERYSIPELLELREQVVIVRKVIDEAYEVLRNLSMREAYRQCLEEEL